MQSLSNATNTYLKKKKDDNMVTQSRVALNSYPCLCCYCVLPSSAPKCAPNTPWIGAVSEKCQQGGGLGDQTSRWGEKAGTQCPSSPWVKMGAGGVVLSCSRKREIPQDGEKAMSSQQEYARRQRKWSLDWEVVCGWIAQCPVLGIV